MSSSETNEYANFSQAELSAYQLDKKRYFKGTIAVSVVYGGFAFLLLIVALFDSRSRQILSEDLLPFVLTLVGFMILIIITLVVLVVNFKPKKSGHNVYDPDVCPDYWNLVATPANEIPATASDVDRQLMKYRCEPDPKVFDMTARWHKNAEEADDALRLESGNITSTDAGVSNAFNQLLVSADGKTHAYSPLIGTDDVSAKLKDTSAAMYNSVANVKSDSNLMCDKVYPALLASKDEALFPNAPNALRCKYAKTCGISWSSVCPDS